MYSFGCNVWAHTVLVFLIFPLTAKAHPHIAYTLQERATEQDKNRAPTADATPPKTDSADPRGNVEGQTYKNAFLGFEFTLPEDLQFQEQPAAESDPATGRQIIAIHAGSKPRNRFSLRKYIVDKAIMFVADPLARHPPDERSDAGYMCAMVQVEKAQGFKQTGDASVDKISDIVLSRANFVHGSRYHLVLAALRKDYAFVFIFVANDIGTAEGLIRSTTLKLPQ